MVDQIFHKEINASTQQQFFLNVAELKDFI